MLRRLAALLWLGTAVAAQAAIVSERPDHVAVTIYHEGTVHTQDLSGDSATPDTGLAMISESRSVDLPEGISEIQLRGVAATMVPQTAELDGLEDAALERNFDYDLLSPGALLKKSVGATVRLIRTDPKTGAASETDAMIASATDGTILKIGDGYEVLHCGALPERLVFDHVPDGLIDRPTLTIKVRARRAGRYALTLRYVATGLNWSADYVARVRPDGRSLALSGWLTLANFSESGFPAAGVDVIAGHVQTTGEDKPVQAETSYVTSSCGLQPAMLRRMMGFAAPPPAAAPAPISDMEQVTVSSSRIEARNLGDYKQYPLPEKTDMAAKQTKQIQFLDQPAVPFDRVYLCRAGDEDYSAQGDWQMRAARILLRLHNTTAQGLGKPLPAGDVTTMVDEHGEPLLAGQGSLQDIPIGLPLELQAGETGDVLSEVRETEDRSIGPNDNRRRLRVLEVRLSNQKSVPVDFEWHQEMMDTAKVRDESDKHGDKNGDAVWAVRLQAGERRMLHYSLDEPY